MAGKKFTASTEADRQRPPIEFELEGVWARGHVPEGSDGSWTLELTAWGAPPLAAIDALRDAIITDDSTGREVANPGSIMRFLRAVLVPESQGDFHRLVEDPSRIVSIAALSDITFWLAEELTGRPTGAPSSSSTGGAASGDGAPAGSGSPASTGIPQPS